MILPAVVATAVACSKRSPPPEPLPEPPIRAEVVGCEAWAEGPVCEVSDEQELRIVVDGAAVPKVRVDGVLVAPTSISEVADGRGRRIAIRVPSAARTLVLGDAAFSLSLAKLAIPSWVGEANRLRRSAKLDAARSIADAHLGDGGVDGARAKALAARIALARGDAEGAVRLFRASIATFAATGRLSEEADDRFACSWALSKTLLRFDEAAQILEHRPALHAIPETRARAAYYGALVSLGSADLRAGLAALATARALAERFGLVPELRDATEVTATALYRMGRADEARERLIALDAADPDAPPCRRADRLVTLGIVTRASSSAPQAGVWLGKAIDLLRQGCPGGYRETNALVERALTALEDGDAITAKRDLEAARALGGPQGAWLVLAELDLEGRIALAEKRPAAALVAFDRALALSPRAVTRIEARWSSLTGRGEALVALGRNEPARAAFVEAEAILDDAALLVPTGEGRGVLTPGHERSARGLVEVLVRGDRAREALDAARAARARVQRALVAIAEIAALDPAKRARWEASLATYRRARAELEASAEKEWTLSANDLDAARAARTKREAELRAALDDAMALLAKGQPAATPPLVVPDGSAVVTWHAGIDAGVAFVATSAGVQARRTTSIASSASSASTEALASALLGPLHDDLAAAKRVRIVAAGPLSSIDLHALELDGAPLATRLPVEWSLDVPELPSAPAAPLRVVVASDPDGNLPAARDEGDDVARLAREALGATVTRLHQREVTVAALTSALAGASLFHFAGHARSGASWAAALSMADGGRLTVADILAAPSAPNVAVLTACEAARSSPGSEALGIAQAFVIAGSRYALAPSRPVDDAHAGAFGRAFHRSLGKELDVAEAYRLALLELRAHAPGADWAAFRLFAR